MADPVTDTDVASRLARLKALKEKRNQSTKLNKQALYQDSKKPKVVAKSSDPVDEVEKTERQKNLEYTLEDCERWEAKKLAQRAKLGGEYQNFNHLAQQTYNKAIKDLEVDKHDYHTRKKNTTEDIIPSNKPDAVVVQKLADSINETNAERMKKKRRHEEDASSYINEKNRQFNMKLNRDYKS
ncbi:uncharacterized protein CANTADRAFT_259855 [Suhomyces tanzawaensis NRRL Y-17324]|uniref:Pre-mRNA-splicing factor SYF2 n=1 Tax=Suhomyces tanzawaensis NRRL Y-17324 TaxID=984487 RepID=A0A1E4SJ00_9ASCO|nr:uncharacterized protein CANTADRAFT_259855 [Suhomyces tanzawaensis NRRL Y-17324]ODV79479.1 hypothetical protein CANTADRAFT_259855 [Suhomyces tanzawaensis NRRL Y-17324]